MRAVTKYESGSGSGSGNCHIIAECFELFDHTVSLTFLVEIVVVIAAEIFKDLAVRKDVIDSNQHRMGYSDISPFSPAVCTDPGKLSAKE